MDMALCLAALIFYVFCTMAVVLAVAIVAARDCPALQVILAGIIYAIIIAMIVMEFLM